MTATTLAICAAPNIKIPSIEPFTAQAEKTGSKAYIVPAKGQRREGLGKNTRMPDPRGGGTKTAQDKKKDAAHGRHSLANAVSSHNNRC